MLKIISTFIYNERNYDSRKHFVGGLLNLKEIWTS